MNVEIFLEKKKILGWIIFFKIWIWLSNFLRLDGAFKNEPVSQS